MDVRQQNVEHYIAANKSDPFCRARVECHNRQSGTYRYFDEKVKRFVTVATSLVGFTAQGEDAFYSAVPFQEDRVTAAGTHYTVTVYRNIQRP